MADGVSWPTEDQWLARATDNAISEAKSVITGGGVNGRAMVGSLSDIEWGWLTSSIIFGWVKTKAEQAVAEGSRYELAIRSVSNRDPEPWEAGAIHASLPALADLNLPWGKPVQEWEKEEITALLWGGFKLLTAAFAYRDIGAADLICRPASVEARLMNESAGGPLLAGDEATDLMFSE